MYCLMCFCPLNGIELLLRDDWQTRRKQGEKRKKRAVFSTLYVVQWQIPLLAETFSALDTCREINHCVWPSVCCLNAEAVYFCLSSVSALNVQVKKCMRLYCKCSQMHSTGSSASWVCILTTRKQEA